MRIHGDICIHRRTNIEKMNDYHKYLPFLIEDFFNICGYCGKSHEVNRNGFEIDHLIPQSEDASLINEYTNLVYSCFTCNRKKSGCVGFVDPACSEYDKHLGRNNTGKIEYYTEIGKYMYDRLKFRYRPTEIVWKTMELYKKLSIIASMEKDGYATTMDYKNYVHINEEIRDLLSFLLDKGE